MTQIRQIYADKKGEERTKEQREQAFPCTLSRVPCPFFCLNPDSQDYKIYRMRNIEIENTKAGSTAAIYTPSSWHCCRDAMLRVFSGNNGKATNPVRHCGLDPQSLFIGFMRFIRREASPLYPVRHCGLDPQSPFIRFIRREASPLYPVRHCGLDPQSPFIRFIRREASPLYPVRHCGLDPQSPSIRFIRREASRLYNSGDSDLRQNDGYCYTEGMSRRGLNMYNPLQAERSWGYRMTPTLSELRSSSTYKSEDKMNRLLSDSSKIGVLFLIRRSLELCQMWVSNNIKR